MSKELIQQAAGKMTNGKTPPTLQQYIEKMKPGIAAALPSVLTPERFTRMVLSAVSSNPQLAGTTPASFLGAMMTAAQLGLEPNTPLGQAYLIPFRNNKKGVVECQFQLGYKGLIDLAYRSGEISTIQAQVVYENDTFEYAFGLEPTLKHVPAMTDRGAPSFVYAVFRTKDGGYGFEVMSVDDIRQHARKYSKAYDSGPWKTNFEEMAKKTVLKRVLKYAPLKSDFLRGVSQDETVKLDLSADMYEVPAEEYDVDADPAVPAADPETGEVIDGQYEIK
ncbi:MAG: recombinase RecT [Oscillospiraceae bacterium]|nr:recombinase RecT [Oscillospiraceae bacterium]